MAEKTAQEQYADARKALIDVGQHGIAWSFQKAWDALREEHRVATEEAVLREVQAVKPYVPAEQPAPGDAGEGGGASSQAGTDDKSALPGGVIA